MQKTQQLRCSMATLLLHRSPRAQTAAAPSVRAPARAAAPSAPTNAPSPREALQGSARVKEALGGAPSFFWAPISATSYRGESPRHTTRPCLPDPRSGAFFEGGDPPAANPYRSHTHATHADPGTVSYSVVKRDSNLPSQFDHPFLGLHDPKRRERLAALTALNISAHTAQFEPPPKHAYRFAPAAPPYPPTAHLAMRFDDPSVNPDAGCHRINYTSQTQATHAPLLSPRYERHRRNANLPSEHDHPFLGLHDPRRKERLAAITAGQTCSTADQFLPPPRHAYSSQRRDRPPYADTAKHVMQWGL